MSALVFLLATIVLALASTFICSNFLRKGHMNYGRSTSSMVTRIETTHGFTYLVARAIEVTTTCRCHLSLLPDSRFLSLATMMVATGHNNGGYIAHGKQRWLHLSMLSAPDLATAIAAIRI